MHYGAEHTYGARVDDAWTYRGLKTVVIENELLRVVVLADKGADIVSLVSKPTDTEFMWRSPWGVRDPRPYVPTTGSGTGLWLDFYEGGWQSIFPNGGYGATQDNAELGLHGESSLMPWDVTVTERGPDRASVTFDVRLARTPFLGRRTIALESKSPTVVVTETITNVGNKVFPTSYGQHIALGPPFLSEACVLDLPGGTVHVHPIAYSPNHRLKPDTRHPWPHAELHDGSLVDLRAVPPPGFGCEDQAYIEDLVDGWYAMTNTATGVGLAVRFPHELYRFLWYWQVFSGGHGYPWWGQTYNVGLEPFTSATNEGIEAAVANNSAVMLAAGAELQSELRLTAFSSHRGVQGVDANGAVTTLEESS